MDLSLIVGLVFISVTLSFSQNVTVTTDLGEIVGRVNNITLNGTAYSATEFLGIPYAEPPIGSGRFNKPVRKAAFKETFIAHSKAPSCMQNMVVFRTSWGIEPDAPLTFSQSEDCLYLNIYLPEAAEIDLTKKRTVMIWIHGSGFQQGSQNFYDGIALAAVNDIILVTFNYRLSALGFLSSLEENESGNYGLWDQHMAIQWVHDHIASFGGDPDQVTIFGHSACAASVIYQALYEGNNGLFQRVIAQSGSVQSGFAYEPNPTETFLNFANMTGCWNKRHYNIIDCLRKLNVTDLMSPLAFYDEFRPVLDGKFVKVHATEIFSNKTDEAWRILKQFGK